LRDKVELLAVILVNVGDHVVVDVFVGLLDDVAVRVDDLSPPASVGNVFPAPFV
jgi:hypothetical protein